ncbi:hypothetical protein [Luteipulveratus halotolerans]|uniref:PLAT domain-containing protein n=1 Tax=Luteipulveratus halotolerans TaxID=1631356 RepID=A0A0L6CMV6_9MICO|nr:hypothetical protein [Luteipulveratus halotolerans]KNX38883.1 hypothetical protein VV01_19910 [Luteipulveratus halotolerans]
MVDITSISVTIQTRRTSGAGTDGDVYLGFCGREFYLDSDADDYESGSAREYVLGDGGNTHNAGRNDPRTPQLQVEDADGLPAYIRFEPTGRDDNWALQRATVRVNGDLFPMWDSLELFDQRVGLWLGTRSGLVAHLPKHQDGKVTQADVAR